MKTLEKKLIQIEMINKFWSLVRKEYHHQGGLKDEIVVKSLWNKCKAKVVNEMGSDYLLIKDLV